MTLSSMLGPTERVSLWREAGGGGSENFGVVGVGREDDEGSGRAEVEEAPVLDSGTFSGGGGLLGRKLSSEALGRD